MIQLIICAAAGFAGWLFCMLFAATAFYIGNHPWVLGGDLETYFVFGMLSGIALGFMVFTSAVHLACDEEDRSNKERKP
jgi:hypothetical protein